MALKARAPRTEEKSRRAVAGDAQRLNLVLDPKDYKKLKRLAFNRGTTMKLIAAEALAAFLSKQPKELVEAPALDGADE